MVIREIARQMAVIIFDGIVFQDWFIPANISCYSCIKVIYKKME